MNFDLSLAGEKISLSHFSAEYRELSKFAKGERREILEGIMEKINKVEDL